MMFSFKGGTEAAGKNAQGKIFFEIGVFHYGPGRGCQFVYGSGSRDFVKSVNFFPDILSHGRVDQLLSGTDFLDLSFLRGNYFFCSGQMCKGGTETGPFSLV